MNISNTENPQKSMAFAVLFCVTEERMITVIVPYWNAEKWLKRCCESLLKQEGDFEFLLISDHCTDRSDDIARDYACMDDRFCVLWNTRAKGVSGARNTGITVAHGDWITFLDADDEMLPNAYASYMQVIKQDPEAVMHQMNHVRRYAKTNRSVIKYVNKAGRYDTSNMPDAWYGVWNKLFRKDLLKNVRFKEGLQYGEDGLFVMECIAKGTYIHHAGRNVLVVRHNLENMESLSHRKTAQDVIDQIRAYEAFLFRHADMRQFVSMEISYLWVRVSELWT